MKVVVERFDEVPEVIHNAYSTIIRDGALIVQTEKGSKHGYPLANLSKWEEFSDYEG